jgi:hypothetical protein
LDPMAAPDPCPLGVPRHNFLGFVQPACNPNSHQKPIRSSFS